MVRIITFLSFLAASIVCQAQVSENRVVAAFNQIHSSSGVNVFFTQSDTQSIRVESDNQEKLSRIKTEVKNGVLKMYVSTDKKNRNNTFKLLNIYVSAPTITAITAESGSNITLKNGVKTGSKLIVKTSSGSNIKGNLKAKEIKLESTSGTNFIGDITSDIVKLKITSGSNFEGDITSDKLKMEASTGSNINGKATATSLDAEITTGSNIILSGTADKMELNASNASHFNGKNFTVKSAVVGADSASRITLTVTETLIAEANSISKIHYYGNPKDVSTNTSRLGEINKM